MPKIYTKTGDKGYTTLLGGKRIKKTHKRVVAYGNIDELNSFIGLLISEVEEKRVFKSLQTTQSTLFLVGSILADVESKYTTKEDTLNISKHLEKIEQEIDEMEKSLQTLQNFILPGGSKKASLTHVCRTITRRAERSLVKIPDVPQEIKSMVNRLSDYFFVLARYFNKIQKTEDTIWKK